MFEARIKIELDFIYYCKYLEKKRVREFLVFSLVVPLLVPYNTTADHTSQGVLADAANKVMLVRLA